jgi:pimeloyl-ACP methyl ester carboxylesterase
VVKLLLDNKSTASNDTTEVVLNPHFRQPSIGKSILVPASALELSVFQEGNKPDDDEFLDEYDDELEPVCDEKKAAIVINS